MARPVDRRIPSELPVLPIGNRVLFPGGLLRLSIGQARSVRLIESLLEDFQREKNVFIAVVARRSPPEGEEDEAFSVGKPQEPVGRERGDPDVYTIGTVGRVTQLLRATGEQAFVYSVLVEGVCCIRLDRFVRRDPFFTAQTFLVKDLETKDRKSVNALSISLRDAVIALLRVVKVKERPLEQKIQTFLDSMGRSSPNSLVVLLVSSLEISTAEKQAVLEAPSLSSRLEMAIKLVHAQTELFKLSNKIHSQLQGQMSETKRNSFLRQQLKVIKQELAEGRGRRKKSGASTPLRSMRDKKKGGAGSTGVGDGRSNGQKAERSEGGDDLDEDDDEDDEESELTMLEHKLQAANLPPDAQKIAWRELKRLRSMQPIQPEYNVLRSYLEWLADLPWQKETEDVLAIERVKQQLDEDHYGLEKVKKRLVEYMAVRSLKKDVRGPILCLVGPPGVGKTSLGKSIATALGRAFYRISLGGVRDESEIRGHRRTYVGSMPGNIVHGLKRAGTKNPVVLLDEIDKLSRDVRGDPSSALLEVLDPAQNHSFTDHYLNTPFDLSRVLFMATANDADSIPAALLDRMEVISIPGYTLQEKVEIAKAYLLPRQMSEHGIGRDILEVPDASLEKIASSYTREAGVRNLERQLAAICRFVAVRLVEWRRERETHSGGDMYMEEQDGAEDHPDHGGRVGALCRKESEEVGDVHVSQPDSEKNDESSMDAADSGSDGVKDETETESDRSAGCPREDQAADESHSAAEPPLTRRTRQEDSPRAKGNATAPNQSSGEGSAQPQRERLRGPHRPPALVSAARGDFPALVVSPGTLVDILGLPRFHHESMLTSGIPGVCTGLAWTPAGGDLLFVEVNRMQGTGQIQLTGTLGDVLKESAALAISWMRSNAGRLSRELAVRPALPASTLPTLPHSLSLPAAPPSSSSSPSSSPSPTSPSCTTPSPSTTTSTLSTTPSPPPPPLHQLFDRSQDLHVHFPAGATPKDGPSAGVAICLALLSLAFDRVVPTDVAMTGEITLRGLVLPVGGIKEKVLAAHRAGIRRIILPERNFADLSELPYDVTESLQIFPVKNLFEVISIVFPASAEEEERSGAVEQGLVEDAETKTTVGQTVGGGEAESRHWHSDNAAEHASSRDRRAASSWDKAYSGAVNGRREASWRDKRTESDLHVLFGQIEGGVGAENKHCCRSADYAGPLLKSLL